MARHTTQNFAANNSKTQPCAGAASSTSGTVPQHGSPDEGFWAFKGLRGLGVELFLAPDPTLSKYVSEFCNSKKRMFPHA